MITKTTDATASSLIGPYNALCKRILSKTFVVAHILKTCVEEFEGCSVSEIENLIDGHHPSGDGQFIGKDSVNISSDKDIVNYDILNTVHLPDSEDYMYINIEAQKDYYPGYNLYNRGEYYLGEMMSMHRGVEFKHSHYSDIKLCKTIWICYEAPKYMQNTIYRHPRCNIHIEGRKVDNISRRDLTEIVVICLGEYEQGQQGLLGLLNLLFTTTQKYEEKVRILKEDFDIELTKEEDKKEVKEMCNVGEGIFERGNNYGFKQGAIQTQIDNIKNVMDTLSIPLTQAMDVLKIPLADREKYTSLIS